LLLDCHAGQVSMVLVDGVDNAVAGDLVVRHSAGTDRRRALADAPRLLRLAEPLQRDVWRYLLERVDRPARTGAIARTLGCSREHLSRQFGAGGAPNLKRVIDLTRVACAASLLRNPGYNAGTVARILRFATASHLSATARRIAGVSTRGLGPLGPRGVLAHFAKGKTRSRI
jgi:AraC-like DNA-binding protein